MSAIRMYHATDPRTELLEKVGDVSEFKIMSNQVLIAVYIRPEKTKGGILLADTKGGTRDEDRFQGKVGLVIGLGPSAFQDDPEGKWFGGNEIKIGDWVVLRPSDGWQMYVNDTLCRLAQDTMIRGIVPHPDMVF